MTQVTDPGTAVRTTVVSGPTAAGSAADYELFFARRALAKLKSLLGQDGLRELLKADTDANDLRWTEWIAQSNEQFRPAVTELSISGLSAEEFFAYFESIRRDEAKMLAAQPEHFVFDYAPDGFDLIENLGPYIHHHHMHFTTDADAIDELLEDYPIRMVGHGTQLDGTVSGHILHHFRETDEGFDARLAVYFPTAVPEEIIEGHRQHLAVEFTNWVAAAAATLGRNTR